MLYSRVSSGLDLLDAAIGGLFSNRVYLVRGPSQSGRTTMALQFLLGGIENDEVGIMISDDRIENVILKAESMGISLEQHLTSNKLILMEYPKGIVGRQYSFGTIIELLGEIEQYIRHYKCQRLVFDTLHPLLLAPREPQLVNYVYSLMNSIEELNATTLVTTGDPNSQTAHRITQLIEDAVVGSFTLTTSGSGEHQRRTLAVQKMIDRINPPYSFRVRMEYGTGLVQEMDADRPRSDVVTTSTDSQALGTIPLRMSMLEQDEDTVAQIEDTFHDESEITVFETEAELKPHLMNLESDLFLINADLPELDWQRIIGLLREAYPKMPVFLITRRRTGRITGQMARQAGADGLFHKPIAKKDLLNALYKAYKQHHTLEDVLAKRNRALNPSSLPEDFNRGVDSEGRGLDEDFTDNILTPSEFKAVLARQVWRSQQDSETFALVSFKMVYISDIGKLPHLPQGLELVRKVASVITSALRGTNDSACRYMDKVVVLLEDTDEQGAKAFSNRILKVLREEMASKLDIQIGKHLNLLTASALFPHDGEVANELMTQVTDVSRNFVKLY